MASSQTNFNINIKHLKPIENILKEYFSGEEVISRENSIDDINGTDFVVRNKNGLNITVDVKVMGHNTYIVNSENKKELCIILEHEHVYTNGNRKNGWSLLSNKNTNYIMYYYVETNEYRILPFIEIRKTFKKNLEKYKKEQKNDISVNDGYITKWIKIAFSDFVKDMYLKKENV